MGLLAYLITIAVAYPLSLLPFSVIYFVSDISRFITFGIFRYREQVILTNLRNAFPEKNDQQIQAIADQFKRNFCDIMLENVKFLSITPKELEERFVIKDRVLIDGLYNSGRSAMTTLGHVGNWEMASLAAGHMLHQKNMAIYRPLHNKWFDRKIRAIRARFGMELVPQNNIRNLLKQLDSQATLFHFITDQTPPRDAANHWTIFLNQETPVYMGAEKVAKMGKLPILYCNILRTKRGHYELEFLDMIQDPTQYKTGEITEIHTRYLERNIRQQPDNWLWSHKRWKHTRPADKALGPQISLATEK